MGTSVHFAAANGHSSECPTGISHSTNTSTSIYQVNGLAKSESKWEASRNLDWISRITRRGTGGEKLGTLKDCSDWVMGIISNEHEQIVPRFKEYVWKPKPAASKTSGQVASDESTEDTKVESGPSNSTPDASKTNPTSTGEVAVNESNSAFENVDELHSKINELNTPNYEDHSYRPPLSPIIEEENGEAQPLEANQSAEPDMDGRRSRRGHRVPSPSPSPSPPPEEKSKTD